MAGEINRVPEGLLSILDMKARGQSPRTLADQVSGTIELLPLYLVNQRIWRAGATPAISAPAAYTVVTVPEREYWWVNRIMVRTAVVLPAATEYVCAISIQRTALDGFVYQMALTDPAPRFVAGDRVGIAYEGPMLAQPGDGFGLYCVDAVVGTATLFACVVDYTPIPI